MSKTLDIIMSLKDNVSPQLGKMNTNLQNTSGKLNAVGKSVGKLGGIIKGALVGGAIAKFSYDCLKAYDVQIQAEKSVQRALEKTGKTSVEAQQGLKEFKDFASKQQDITAFGDEGTLQVISGLISQGFGKKSIEDIVAMSQDIARSTGDEQENVTWLCVPTVTLNMTRPSGRYVFQWLASSPFLVPCLAVLTVATSKPL